jgi:hypothetical protein
MRTPALYCQHVVHCNWQGLTAFCCTLAVVIGGIQTEADLRAAILREIGDLPEKIVQLQGRSKAAAGVRQGLMSESAIIPGGTAGAVGGPANGNFLGLGGTTGSAPMPFLAGLDYALGGMRTLLRLDLTLAVNATAPGVNFTAGLAPVVAVAGGAGVIAYTVGANVASVAINAPGASSLSHVESVEFDFPADDFYVLTLTTSGATAANSRVSATVRLDARHV